MSQSPCDETMRSPCLPGTRSPGMGRRRFRRPARAGRAAGRRPSRSLGAAGRAAAARGGVGGAAAARARGLRGDHGGRGVRPPPRGAAGGVEGPRRPGAVAGRRVPGRGARLRDDRQRLQRRASCSTWPPTSSAGCRPRWPGWRRARSTGTAPASSATPPCTCPTTSPPRPTRSWPRPRRSCGSRTCRRRRPGSRPASTPRASQKRKDEARHDRRVELRREDSGAACAGGAGARPGRGAGGEGVDRRRGGPAPQRGPARHPGPDPGDDPHGPDPPAQPLGPPRPAAHRTQPEPDAGDGTRRRLPATADGCGCGDGRAATPTRPQAPTLAQTPTAQPPTPAPGSSRPRPLTAPLTTTDYRTTTMTGGRRRRRGRGRGRGPPRRVRRAAARVAVRPDRPQDPAARPDQHHRPRRNAPRLVEHPADVGTWGLMDADTVRDLIEAASRHPRTRWCYTLTGQDGRGHRPRLRPRIPPLDPARPPPASDGPSRDGPAAATTSAWRSSPSS